MVEVLLQRTRAEVVRGFAPRFFARYRGWSELAAADLSELSEALRPIGLHERRAASLSALANAMTIRDSRRDDDWESLPGIGQYIGRAVRVAISADQVAMLDANFVRMVRRVFGGRGWMSDYRYDARLQALALAIVRGARDSRVVNWAVLDLGAAICMPRKPRCAECPLQSLCDLGRQVSISEGV